MSKPEDKLIGEKLGVVAASFISSSIFSYFIVNILLGAEGIAWITFFAGFFLYPIIGALFYLPIVSLWNAAFPNVFESPHRKSDQEGKLTFLMFWPIIVVSGIALCPAMILVNSLTKAK